MELISDSEGVQKKKGEQGDVESLPVMEPPSKSFRLRDGSVYMSVFARLW